MAVSCRSLNLYFGVEGKVFNFVLNIFNDFVTLSLMKSRYFDVSRNSKNFLVYISAKKYKDSVILEYLCRYYKISN